jgi:hypothetical protein
MSAASGIAIAAAPVRDFAGAAHGLDRLPLVAGDHGQIIAVADHLDHAGKRLNGCDIERLQRATAAWRADYPRMQHAWQAQVLDERRAATDLGRDVQTRQRMADEFEVGSGHRGRPGLGVLMHIDMLDRVGITHPLTGRAFDYAIVVSAAPHQPSSYAQRSPSASRELVRRR